MLRLSVLKHIIGDRKLPLEIELVRVYLSSGRVFRLPPERVKYPGGDPSRVAELSAQTDKPLLVHGTSWRYDDANTPDFGDDTLLVTYVVVLPAGQDGEPVRVYGEFKPDERSADSVAAHAVEHLALLEGRHSIKLPADWQAALKKYKPAPAMQKNVKTMLTLRQKVGLAMRYN